MYMRNRHLILCSLFGVCLAQHPQETEKNKGAVLPEPRPLPNTASSAQAPGLPEPCLQVDVAKCGRPVVFPGREVFGVSTPRNHPKQDEEVRIYIWLSNESATSREMLTCCESLFLARIEVFDASGRRLDTGPEAFDGKTREQGHEPIHSCTCSAMKSFPPSFCGVVDSGNLSRPDTAYDLPPGKYTIEERAPKPSIERSRSLLQGTSTSAKTGGLAITIEDR